MLASIQIRLEGGIDFEDHTLTLRTYRTVLEHLQSSLDRAYLDVNRPEGVWKHSRLGVASRTIKVPKFDSDYFDEEST